MTLGGGPGVWDSYTTRAPFRSLGLRGKSDGMSLPGLPFWIPTSRLASLVKSHRRFSWTARDPFFGVRTATNSEPSLLNLGTLLLNTIIHVLRLPLGRSQFSRRMVVHDG